MKNTIIKVIHICSIVIFLIGIVGIFAASFYVDSPEISIPLLHVFGLLSALSLFFELSALLIDSI